MFFNQVDIEHIEQFFDEIQNTLKYAEIIDLVDFYKKNFLKKHHL